jgi:polyhydroxyalkanoate synthesis regulator phasin
MKKTQNKSKGTSGGKIVAIGATAAALAGAAYYFLGPKGRKHQRSAKKWTKEASTKVAQKAKQVKNLTESTYVNIVDGVVKPYIAQGAAVKKEADAFARELKSDWKHIKDTVGEKIQTKKKEVKSKVKSATTKAKKAVRKVSR